MRNEMLKNYLRETGLDGDGVTEENIKMINEDEYVLIKPLIFHWTMIRGLVSDTFGYDDRWCYADEEKARKAFDEFPHDPAPDYEPDGWHRHPKSGRRRENADPEEETFAP